MYGTTHFQGRIDHFTISAGVIRTTCQIYNDATLAVYFPFDTIDPFNDHRINQALYFTSSTSYFQSQCFPNSKLDDPPFTFSFWINPSSFIGGSTIIHVSNSLHGNGTLCFDLLALTNTGSVVAQWMLWSNAVEGIQGPVISANTWTHIVYIYSRPNSVRLYINAQLSVTTPSAGSINLRDFDAPFYIILGNISPLGSSASVNCNTAASFPIVSGSFIGAIDDFRIYSRELNPQEICVLANL
ncbi:hypothetical protein I4U23_008894 [Adineta vaga]|nr:hypothetical protein I4U23_008894 [Adineta vaga]